jgi:hypothetical protein
MSTPESVAVPRQKLNQCKKANTTLPSGARLDSANAASKRPRTTAQFLAWQERQELHYEFDGFQPIAMAAALQLMRRSCKT